MSRASRLPPSTVPEMVARQLDERPDAEAVVAWDPYQQRWRSYTWSQLATAAIDYAAQMKPAVAPRERVLTVIENRYEWIVVDLAIQCCGGVHVPLHPQLTSAQIAQLLAHCEPVAIVVSGQKQFDKLPRHGIGSAIYSLDDLAESGVRRLQPLASPPRLKSPQWAELSSPDCTPDSLISILYTSGTTGEPKGVMLSQANVVANALAKVATLPLGPDDVRVMWLPLTHIFARVCDLYTAYLTGCRTIVSRGREFLFEEFQRFRPTYLNAVPLFYERCYQKLTAENRLQPQDLRDLLGGRMQLCNCGGAPLADEIYDFFRDRGIELVTGYGLTEASPVITSNRPTAHRRGSVGQVVPGVEIRIAEDGEVMARGPNIMRGYFRNAEETERTLRGGWLATGDLGRIDEEGFLFLTGRKKELIVTNGGKKIAPTFIENLLLADPLIEQAVVLGDGRDFLVALIHVADRARLGVNSTEDLKPLIRERIDRCLADCSRFEQIVDFAILEQPLSLEDGTLTAKGSLRRHAIANRYRGEIDSLYQQVAERRPRQ